MLFISGEPMSFKKISKYTGIDGEELKMAAENLSRKYSEQGSGLRLLVKDGEAQMVTAAENSKVVESYMKAEIEGELSRAALEVLSVVAYRGPIPRSKIEDIRGVNCSFTLRHLLIRGLIERIDNPADARTYLYRISFDFLKKLGVEKVENLPKYDELKNKKILEERFAEKMENGERASQLYGAGNESAENKEKNRSICEQANIQKPEQDEMQTENKADEKNTASPDSSFKEKQKEPENNDEKVIDNQNGNNK